MIPQQITARLKKLLLMLSSDGEGEVVNAARLIESTLRDAGHDWHHLAGALTESTARPQPKWQPPPREDSEYSGDWRQQRDFCEQHEHLLRGREADFILDLDHWHGPLTEKQASWLSATYQRVRRAT
jgi:hypothetical protein